MIQYASLIPCTEIHDLSRVEVGDKVYLLTMEKNKDWTVYGRTVKHIEVATGGDFKGEILLTLSDGSVVPIISVWPDYRELIKVVERLVTE